MSNIPDEDLRRICHLNDHMKMRRVLEAYLPVTQPVAKPQAPKTAEPVAEAED